MEKKKLLFVSHEHNGVHGSTRSMMDLVDSIQMYYSNVECLILIPRKGDTYRTLKGKGYRVYQLPYSMCVRDADRMRVIDFIRNELNLVFAFFIAVFARIHNVDRIISNSSVIDVGAMAALIARIEHVYYIRELTEKGIGCKYIAKKRFMSLIRKTKYIICISKYISSNYVKELEGKDYLVLWDTIDVERYYNPQHIPLQNHFIEIAQIGNLVDYKKPIETLKMLKKLIDIGINDFHFTFYGTGSDTYLQYLKEYIDTAKLNEHVHLYGYCSDIENKLSETDVLINSSEIEGLGRTTIEAMLSGCVVIGKNAGATMELIANNKTGYLFDGNNDCANIIRQIFENRTEAIMVSEQGRKWAVDNFDKKKQINIFMDYIYGEEKL